MPARSPRPRSSAAPGDASIESKGVRPLASTPATDRLLQARGPTPRHPPASCHASGFQIDLIRCDLAQRLGRARLLQPLLTFGPRREQRASCDRRHVCRVIIKQMLLVRHRPPADIQLRNSLPPLSTCAGRAIGHELGPSNALPLRHASKAPATIVSGARPEHIFAICPLLRSARCCASQSGGGQPPGPLPTAGQSTRRAWNEFWGPDF